MKAFRRFTTFLMLVLYGSTMCFGRSDEVINLQHIGDHDDHSEYYPPADMPEVYFDFNDLEIILVADGFAAYYDVNIISQSTMLAVISTQIGGYGDTIDVYSLPDDDYTIIITSSNNNQYEGEFTNY